MTICEQTIRQLHDYLAAALICGPNEAKYEVVSTPFFYPDRDNVELFMSQAAGGKVLLSDLGQTIVKLSEYGFTPYSSPRRRAMIFQIVSSLNVRYDNGSIQVVVEPDNIGGRAWDLLLAIQRLSDLVFTVPGYTKATFPDEFENYVIAHNIPYERGIPIELAAGVQLPISGETQALGQMAARHRFVADFVVKGRKVVELLSASSSGYARVRADRVYVNFAEMKLAGDDRATVAVVDDTQDVWDGILRPLRNQADRILYWTHKIELEKALLA
jgi:hypothetical protein